MKIIIKTMGTPGEIEGKSLVQDVYKRQDTFRAGAVAQLAEWGRRVDVPVVTGPEKADPASVVFDGMERAVAEGVDICLLYTSIV